MAGDMKQDLYRTKITKTNQPCVGMIKGYLEFEEIFSNETSQKKCIVDINMHTDMHFHSLFRNTKRLLLLKHTLISSQDCEI